MGWIYIPIMRFWKRGLPSLCEASPGRPSSGSSSPISSGRIGWAGIPVAEAMVVYVCVYWDMDRIVEVLLIPTAETRKPLW